MIITTKERGYKGHFCGANNCLFGRNTLIKCESISVVVSTVGVWIIDGVIAKIGLNRYYETMIFESSYDKYDDANVSHNIYIDGKTCINSPSKDIGADAMHDNAVKEVTKLIENNNLWVERYNSETGCIEEFNPTTKDKR